MDNRNEEPKDKAPERGPGRPWTVWERVKCAFWCVAVILFAVWMWSWVPLLLLPLVVDNYWTHYINWGWWKSIPNGLLRGIMSWVDAIVFALCAVWVLQNFFFQNFQIPTTSLEKTYLAGDYLLVSKYHYGPRVPMTPLSLPLFQHTIEIGPFNLGKSYIERPQVPYRRMAGLRDVGRNDIVVFNYPSGDTVATRMQNDDYYRLRFHHGVEALHTQPETYGEIIYRPVDRRENYVKRCVGLPGDTLAIVDDTVMIGGRPLADPPALQHNYFVVMAPGGSIGETSWRRLGCHIDDIYPIDNPQVAMALGLGPDTLSGQWPRIYLTPLTAAMRDKLRQLKAVADIIACPAEFFGKDYVYPLAESNPWTRSDYGPIVIPSRGMTIALDSASCALYGRCITTYEGNRLDERDGHYYVNGVPAETYTFAMDYYWMMGDNRDNSADSRYWGFVPEDHIVGTPLLLWCSKDLETGEWRSDRFLRSVADL